MAIANGIDMEESKQLNPKSVPSTIFLKKRGAIPDNSISLVSFRNKSTVKKNFACERRRNLIAKTRGVW
jgi:hypothetical protein